MPLSSLRCCCSGGSLVLTAALALLLTPLTPDLLTRLQEEAPTLPGPPLPRFVDRMRALCPPVDLFATVIMLTIVFVIYLCEWIQRKLMERRIVKLKQHLLSSVEQLRALDTKQEQLEGTLRLVRAAAGEYDLLLLLLLRRRTPHTPHTPHVTHNTHAPRTHKLACYFDKDLDD